MLKATAVHVLSIHGQCHSPTPSSSALPGKAHPVPLLSNSGVFWHKGSGEKTIALLFGALLPRLACLVFEGF